MGINSRLPIHFTPCQVQTQNELCLGLCYNAYPETGYDGLIAILPHSLMGQAREGFFTKVYERRNGEDKYRNVFVLPLIVSTYSRVIAELLRYPAGIQEPKLRMTSDVFRMLIRHFDSFKLEFGIETVIEPDFARGDVFTTLETTTPSCSFTVNGVVIEVTAQMRPNFQVAYGRYGVDYSWNIWELK